MTVWERELALQKFTRYLREKVRLTGSVRSILVDSSGLSTFWCVLSVTAPFPISPEQENLTPSFVASIATVHKERVSTSTVYTLNLSLFPYLTPTTDSNHDRSSETPPKAK